jgi:hypothetical protein
MAIHIKEYLKMVKKMVEVPLSERDKNRFGKDFGKTINLSNQLIDLDREKY